MQLTMSLNPCTPSLRSNTWEGREQRSAPTDGCSSIFLHRLCLGVRIGVLALSMCQDSLGTREGLVWLDGNENSTILSPIACQVGVWNCPYHCQGLIRKHRFKRLGYILVIVLQVNGKNIHKSSCRCVCVCVHVCVCSPRGVSSFSLGTRQYLFLNILRAFFSLIK